MSPSIYLAFPLMLVLLILQVTISPHIQITGVEPQLLFLITVSWGLFFGLQPGLIWAFIAGIFIDLFSVGPAGASSLALMSAVAVAVLAKQLLPPNQILMPALLGGVASLVFWFVYIILLRVLVPVMIDSLDFLSVSGLVEGARGQDLISDVASNYGLGGSVGNLVLRSTLLHSLLMVPTYWALRTLNRLFTPRGVEI